MYTNVIDVRKDTPQDILQTLAVVAWIRLLIIEQGK